MVDEPDSIYHLRLDLAAYRESFSYAHLNSQMHQEGVVGASKASLAAAAIRCVNKGNGEQAYNLLKAEQGIQGGVAAGISWSEVVDHALSELQEGSESKNSGGPATSTDGAIFERREPKLPDAPTPTYLFSPAPDLGATKKAGSGSILKPALVRKKIQIVFVSIIVLYFVVSRLVTVWQSWGSSAPPEVEVPVAPSVEDLQASAAEFGEPGNLAYWGGFNAFDYQHWTNGSNAQIGSAENPFAVTSVLGVNGVQQVVSNEFNAYALMSDGTVMAWGSNTSGGRGSETVDYLNPPNLLPGLTNVTQIETTFLTAFAVLKDGTVWTWGSNENGVLGTGSKEEDSTTPVQVTGLSDVVSVSGSNGTVYAVRGDGTVWAWGANQRGNLGGGSRVEYSNVPVQVAGLSNVQSVAAGPDTAYAVLADGTVWGWGSNGFNLLVGGSTPSIYEPVQIPGLANVQSVSPGYYASYAILADGTAISWGATLYGMQGDGLDTGQPVAPSQVPGLNNVKTIVTDRDVAYAVLTDGSAMAWGSNKYGLLGIGSQGLEQVSKVVPVKDLTNVAYISIGLYSTHALLTDGTVATWGMKDLRNMGQVDVEVWTSPQIVTGLTNITSLDTGIMGNYAVTVQ